jgi:putative flavoprotein involved in K+ transport
MSGATRHAEVIVVGGGQAGMAAGYYLSRAGIPFLILDAGTRAGAAWRQRWDTLELFTPARYSSLPGMRFPGSPGHYPGKDEVAGYMQAYARAFALPVRYNTRVTSLERAAGGYLLHTSAGRYEAGQVIVATGAYQQPWTPAIAAGLSGEVAQLHSAAYRNPGQIPGRKVLVVGAANSGAQIAADLAGTHQVWLSRGAPIRHLPRRILGIPIHSVGDRLGLIPAPFDTWRGRTQRGDLLVGASLRQLAGRHGIRLAGRATRAEGRAVTFADGQNLEVSAVVWATGYRSDYSWIHLPVLGPDSLPRHKRGVTESPGLYFLGMHNQYSRGSSLIHWVRHDAAYIAGQVRAHAARAEADAAPGDDNDQEGTADAREQPTGQLVRADGIPGRW